MAIDSEDIATYATAVATIVGAIVLTPIIFITNKAATVTYNIWEYFTTSDNTNSNQPDNDWNIITIGDLPPS